MQGTSTYQLIGVPQEVGVLISTITLILALAPYLSGADLGIVKIPQLSGRLKKQLKVYGILCFFASLGLFFPLWSRAPQSQPLIAVVRFAFQDYEPGLGIPPTPVLSEGAELRNGISAFGGRGLKIQGWSKDFIIAQPQVDLTSTHQVVDRQFERTVDGSTAVQTNTFEQFKGNLGPFAEAKMWESAIIEAVLQVKGSDDNWLRQALTNDRRVSNERFEKFYGVDPNVRATWELTDYGVSPLFPATLTILLGSMEVARLSGIVARVWEHDEDVRLLHVVRFCQKLQR